MNELAIIFLKKNSQVQSTLEVNKVEQVWPRGFEVEQFLQGWNLFCLMSLVGVEEVKT